MEQMKSNEDVLKVLLILVGIAIAYKVFLSIRQWCVLLSSESPITFYSGITLIVLTFSGLVFYFARKKYLAIREDQGITNGKAEDSVFAGYDERRNKIFINLSFRCMHAQVVGTTNAGKTESVILPWTIDDIEKGRGLVFIDGKADRQLLAKIYAYVVKSGREEDFRILSLSDTGISHSYNPLIGQSVDQVTEKIINSFNIENEYYRTVQFDVLRNVLEIFKEASVIPNFIKLRQAISDPKELLLLTEKTTNSALRNWAFDFINMHKDKRREMVSGLVSNLGFFATSEVAELFNTSEPQINISEAMKKNLILYFQLPVLKSPILGKAVAKMVLQDVQGAVSERHASDAKSHPFFSIYLDDFTEYLTPQFVSLLNKSRSANVGVVFAHQAIGDLEALGPEVKNQIMTNSNLKVFMRTNEPDSAEYFSKIIGTREATKITKRQKQKLFGAEVTDDGSIREVEEFIFHPNFFKSKLGVGEAVIVLPHTRGAKSLLLKFIPRPDLPKLGLPQVKKKAPEVLTVEPATQSASIASLAARRV